MIQSGKADTLAAAYESAIWANPTTRKVLLERQDRNKARQAAASGTLTNRGPSGSMTGTPVEGKSNRAILEQLIPKENNRF